MLDSQIDKYICRYYAQTDIQREEFCLSLFVMGKVKMKRKEERKGKGRKGENNNMSCITRGVDRANALNFEMDCVS